MCGKYHVSTEEENIEMRAFLAQAFSNRPDISMRGGDILPSLYAPVITPQAVLPMVFGVRLSQKQRLLINARSETAGQSPLFAPMMQKNRCLIPTSFFYEWTPDKKPYLFSHPAGDSLYLAGLYKAQGTMMRFVILTRPANASVSSIHHRMPLILPSQELREAWLHSPTLAQDILMLQPDIDLMAQPLSA